MFDVSQNQLLFTFRGQVKERYLQQQQKNIIGLIIDKASIPVPCQMYAIRLTSRPHALCGRFVFLVLGNVSEYPMQSAEQYAMVQSDIVCNSVQ